MRQIKGVRSAPDTFILSVDVVNCEDIIRLLSCRSIELKRRNRGTVLNTLVAECQAHISDIYALGKTAQLTEFPVLPYSLGGSPSPNSVSTIPTRRS